MNISDAGLRGFIAAIFVAVGVSETEARHVADHLVDSNLAGHDSHGVQLVRRYLDHIAKNLCRPGTAAECLKDDGAIMLFDGRRGFGIRIATEAMRAAMDRCRTTGVVLMGMRNVHHLGRIGAYGEMAAAEGLVSLHFANVVDHAPMVAPFNGRDARFGTNPICIAVPGTASKPPFVLDMATSVIALGKITVARQTGKQVPPDSIIDSTGRPTTDPNGYFGPPQGAILPFGDHKGYGLMMAIEILAGALTGYGTIQPATPQQGALVNNMLTVLIDPARLVDMAWLAMELDALRHYVKASPQAGTEPVLVAGEPELASKARRLAHGHELPDPIWADLESVALQVGLDRARIAAFAGRPNA